jgi:hypothetical protein
MATGITFPALSEDGWVTSSAKTADYMLSHFFLSDRSQSYMYDQYISSLPWILTDTQGNIGLTISAVRETLETYFSRYFSKVIVEVSEIPNKEDPGKAQISLYVKFTDKDNKEVVVGKMLKINDTILEKIIALNNG